MMAQNETHGLNAPAQDSDRPLGGEFNILEGVWLLVKHGKLLICMGLAGLILSSTYAFLTPKSYVAKSRVVVPMVNSTGQLFAGVGEFARLAGGNLNASGGDLYVGIARSLSVAAPVIESFNLVEVYNAEYQEDAYHSLNRRMNVVFDSKETILTLEVRDLDPERAAALTNALVDELDRLTISLNLTKASQERAFLEARLVNVKLDLATAEDALKNFQEENRAFRLDDQGKAIIDAFGRLQGELARKEIALGVLRTYQTERNPELQALMTEIEQIRQQLSALEELPTGSKLLPEGFVAAGQLPDLALRYGRLLRDYKVQEVLYEMIAKQYELARVEEVKNTSRLQILDRAAPPKRKSAPKRLFIMVLATSATLFLTVVAIFGYEGWKRAVACEPELAARIRQKLSIKRQ